MAHLSGTDRSQLLLLPETVKLGLAQALLLSLLIMPAMAKDPFSGTPRSAPDEPQVEGRCAVALPVPAENAKEWNMLVGYIDTALRLTVTSYAGYAAQSLQPGEYSVRVDFNESCNVVLSKMIGRTFFSFPRRP